MKLFSNKIKNFELHYKDTERLTKEHSGIVDHLVSRQQKLKHLSKRKLHNSYQLIMSI